MRSLSPYLWELDPHSSSDLPIALIFPFAGGSAHSIREWADRIPGYRHVGVQYPGRGARVGELLAESVEQLSARVLEDYRAVFGGTTPLLLGHSMGSYVALEAARQFEKSGAGASALIASASGPPGTEIAVHSPLTPSPDAAPIHAIPDEQLATALVSAGGLPEEMLHEPELLALTLPAVRHDFHLGWSYSRSTPTSPVSCPILAIGGESDAAVPVVALQAWESFTKDTFNVRTWPGGHYYYRNDLPGLADAIASFDVDGSTTATFGAFSSRAEIPAVEADVLDAVRAVWSELLPAQPLTAETRFFEAGGTSIAAMRGCALLTARLGLRIPVKLLLENGRLQDFAARVAEARQAAR